MRLACSQTRQQVGSICVRALDASTCQEFDNGVQAWLLEAWFCAGLKLPISCLSQSCLSWGSLTAGRLKLRPHLNNMHALVGVRAPGRDCPDAAQAGHHQK